MNSNIFKNTFIIFIYLVIADVACFVASEDFRNAFGVFDVKSSQEYIVRLLPDFILFSFYTVVLFRLQKGNSIPNILLKLYCLLFTLLGLALCIPWGGMFFAPFTPIGVLYVGSILWVPEGFYVSMLIAIMFCITNIYLFKKV